MQTPSTNFITSHQSISLYHKDDDYVPEVTELCAAISGLGPPLIIDVTDSAVPHGRHKVWEVAESRHGTSIFQFLIMRICFDFIF